MPRHRKSSVMSVPRSRASASDPIVHEYLEDANPIESPLTDASTSSNGIARSTQISSSSNGLSELPKVAVVLTRRRKKAVQAGSSLRKMFLRSQSISSQNTTPLRSPSLSKSLYSSSALGPHTAGVSSLSARTMQPLHSHSARRRSLCSKEMKVAHQESTSPQPKRCQKEEPSDDNLDCMPRNPSLTESPLLKQPQASQSYKAPPGSSHTTQEEAAHLEPSSESLNARPQPLKSKEHSFPVDWSFSPSPEPEPQLETPQLPHHSLDCLQSLIMSGALASPQSLSQPQSPRQRAEPEIEPAPLISTSPSISHPLSRTQQPKHMSSQIHLKNIQAQVALQPLQMEQANLDSDLAVPQKRPSEYGVEDRPDPVKRTRHGNPVDKPDHAIQVIREGAAQSSTSSTSRSSLRMTPIERKKLREALASKRSAELASDDTDNQQYSAQSRTTQAEATDDVEGVQQCEGHMVDVRTPSAGKSDVRALFENLRAECERYARADEAALVTQRELERRIDEHCVELKDIQRAYAGATKAHAVAVGRERKLRMANDKLVMELVAERAAREAAETFAKECDATNKEAAAVLTRERNAAQVALEDASAAITKECDVARLAREEASAIAKERDEARLARVMAVEDLRVERVRRLAAEQVLVDVTVLFSGLGNTLKQSYFCKSEDSNRSSVTLSPSASPAMP